MRRINVVYSLITDEARTNVLMVKNNDNGQWTLPGGAVEGDETLDAAAIREAKEETGFDIRVHGIVAFNEAKLLNDQAHAFFVTFRADIVGGSRDISRPNEIGDVAWIPIEQADELMPYYKDGIRNIVKNGTEITYFDEGEVG